MSVRVSVAVHEGRHVVALHGLLAGPLDETVIVALAAVRAAGRPIVLDVRDAVLASVAALAQVVDLLCPDGNPDGISVLCDRLSGRKLVALCLRRRPTDARRPASVVA